MTLFHVVTLFKESLAGYTGSSILKRAQKNKIIKIIFYSPRDYSKDKHKTVDDKAFGGGPGMVLKIEPIIKAVLSVINVLNERTGKTPTTPTTPTTSRTKVVILSPTGKQFTSKLASEWAKRYNSFILICGHYEGIDARVKKILGAEEISIGPYVLTGGELGAGVIIDAVSRQIPGVLGKAGSLEETHGLGVPVYTRPEVFKHKGKSFKVPKVLMSGNHKRINEWRRAYAK